MGSSHVALAWDPWRFTNFFCYFYSYVKTLKMQWNRYGGLCTTHFQILENLQHKLRVLILLLHVLTSLFYLKDYNNLYFYKLSVIQIDIFKRILYICKTFFIATKDPWSRKVKVGQVSFYQQVELLSRYLNILM